MQAMSTEQVTVLPWRPAPTFGERLRMLRKQYGERIGRRLSQRAFAALLDENAANIGTWEADNNKPRDLEGFILKCYKVTRCDPGYWFGVLDTGPNDDGTPGQDPAHAGKTLVQLNHLRRRNARPSTPGRLRPAA